jgi:hypothetical protein
MAITYGFFNSLNHDRTYNAAQITEYFDGLVSDGVYESVGGAMQVQAATNMNVDIQTGRAIIDCRWIRNDAVLTMPITASHVTLARYTAIMVRLDYSARTISIIAVDGTPATSPAKPEPTQTATVKELVLAYLYIPAGATAIPQANIQDQRGTSLCGWVTGLIKQVDTSQLFAQWQDACETFYRDMTAGFNAWFETLTSKLSIDTYIQQYRKDATLTEDTNVIALDMSNYAYDQSDIVHVYINGLMAVPGTDYTLDTSNLIATVTPTATAAGTAVTIIILRSRIGYYVAETADGYILTTSEDNAIEI